MNCRKKKKKKEEKNRVRKERERSGNIKACMQLRFKKKKEIIEISSEYLRIRLGLVRTPECKIKRK